MKKLWTLFALVLAGCTGANDGTYTTSIFNPAPPQTIRNEKCENIPAVRIFQVLDNFALAFTCEKSEYRDNYSCLGMTVYVPKDKNDLLYDDKIIKPKDGQCISFNGTYKYDTKGDRGKTVPKLKMVDAEIPNPEYIKWEKTQQEKIQ